MGVSNNTENVKYNRIYMLFVGSRQNC